MKDKKITGIIDMSKRGHGYLIREGEEDLFIHKKRMFNALNGDTVSVSVVEIEKGKDIEIQGSVSEIKTRKQTEFSGIIEINKKKGFSFVRTAGGKMPVDFYVPLAQINGAKEGDVVVVKLHCWHKKDKSPRGNVIKVIGKSQTHETEMGAIMFKHNIDYSFPKEVMEEAEAIPVEIPEKEILKRRDMREITTICIDPSTARDKDDALSFRALDNGNYEIGVHISDVSFYVKPDSELAKEAYLRGTSIYLIDRVVPMFPTKLSNGICSLHPGKDKLSLSSIFRFNKNGDIVSEWFGRTVVNISKDYSYEEAQDVIEGQTNDGSENDKAVLYLDKLAKKLRKQQTENQSLTINSKEASFELDENNVPVSVKFKVQKDANKLIEQFMLLANKKVCEYITKKKGPMVHRVHESPNQEKLEELSTFVKSVGFELNISNSKNIKSELNNLLEEVKDTPYENMINNLVVRSMSKAKYSTIKGEGHYGLGFEYYTHYTSPIRRFSDYIVHSLLVKAIGSDGYSKK